VGRDSRNRYQLSVKLDHRLIVLQANHPPFRILKFLVDGSISERRSEGSLHFEDVEDDGKGLGGHPKPAIEGRFKTGQR
jgi:hypothetical protein